MAIINLSYPNKSVGRYINISYDDVLHQAVGSAVTGIAVDPATALTQGKVFYTQLGVGEYWDVKVLNTAPYAFVIRTAYVLPCDLAITGVAVVPAMNGNNGSITVTAMGTGTLRYVLNNGIPQVSNVFANRPAGPYVVKVVRTEDSCSDSESIEIIFIPDLVVSSEGQNTTVVGADDGKITVTILQGSGDYSVEFITEGVTVASDGLTPIVRSNLAPGLYDIEITDNISGQTVTLQTTITDPVISPTSGSIFDVPYLNSIRYVSDNNDEEQGLDNKLLCNQVYGTMQREQYYQKFNTSDKPKTQFNSNFLTHRHELRKCSDDSLVATYPIVKVEDNLNKIYTYVLSLVVADAGLTKIFFSTAELPLPLSEGDVFEITDNVDFDGTYAITQVGFDEDNNSQYIIINKLFGAPASPIANGQFKNVTALFDVYESQIVFNAVAEGQYYLILVASLGTVDTEESKFSEPIELKIKHDDVLLIVYSNYDNAFGITWTTGYTGFMRVEGLFGHKRPTGGERTTSRDADFSVTKISARKTRNLMVEIFAIPPYIRERLSVAFDCDVFSINLVPCQSVEGLGGDNYDQSILGDASIMVEQLHWFNKYNSNDNLMSSVSEDGSCACDEIDLSPVATTLETVTLDFANKLQRIFKLQPELDNSKIIVLANSGSALSMRLKFKVTQVFVDNGQYIEFPGIFQSNALPQWDYLNHRLTFLDAGLYDAEATYDGTNWQLTIQPSTFN